MVIGMATQKITITLPKEQVKRVRYLVGSGAAANVSAFIRHAVDTAIQNDSGLNAWLEEALERTGGPLTKEERGWAESVLFPERRKKRPGRRKAA
jgi:Arc/MetJ-type ribon-helix-helix transcriptional regulator